MVLVESATKDRSLILIGSERCRCDVSGFQGHNHLFCEKGTLAVARIVELAHAAHLMTVSLLLLLRLLLHKEQQIFLQVVAGHCI